MFCPHCGKPNKDSGKFCVNCGKSLTVQGGKAAPAVTPVVQQPVGNLVVSPKHKKLGIFFIILPFAVLVGVLFVWAIVIYVARTNGADSGNADLQSTVINIINLILGLVSFLAVFGIFVFVPLGIVFLNKKTVATGGKYDERSGKGDASVVPPEIKGWNWGAAGLTWIWGISNGTWLSLLSFVPVLNYVWWIVLGIKGNEWAWKGSRWESVEQFKATQKTWGIWGMIIFFLGLLVIVFSLISSFATPNATNTTFY